MKLLDIQSSPREGYSNSIALTNAFIAASQRIDSSIVVDTLNVWNENLPEFDAEAIGAKYEAVKGADMTEAENAVWMRIQSLIVGSRAPIELSWAHPCGILQFHTS